MTDAAVVRLAPSGLPCPVKNPESVMSCRGPTWGYELTSSRTRLKDTVNGVAVAGTGGAKE